MAQWQAFTDEQADHNRQAEIGAFLAQFSQSTLENWQSEFMQLFSFTVMAAVLIHKGSAESRDRDDVIQAALKRIEDKLGPELTLCDEPLRQDSHTRPSTRSPRLDGQGRQFEQPRGVLHLGAGSGQGSTKLAKRSNANIVIHRQDATVREA